MAAIEQRQGSEGQSGVHLRAGIGARPHTASPPHDRDHGEHAHALLDAGQQEGQLPEVLQLQWPSAGLDPTTAEGSILLRWLGQQAEGVKLRCHLFLGACQASTPRDVD